LLGYYRIRSLDEMSETVYQRAIEILKRKPTCRDTEETARV